MTLWHRSSAISRRAKARGGPVGSPGGGPCTMDTRLEKDANSEEKRKEGTCDVSPNRVRPRDFASSTKSGNEHTRTSRDDRRYLVIASTTRQRRLNGPVPKFLLKFARLYLIEISNSNFVELLFWNDDLQELIWRWRSSEFSDRVKGLGCLSTEVLDDARCATIPGFIRRMCMPLSEICLLARALLAMVLIMPVMTVQCATQNIRVLILPRTCRN